MPNFIFKDNHAQFKSFLIYEMLNKGFLTSNSIYICKDHNEKLIKKYLDNFEKSIKKLNSLIKNKKFNNFIKNIKTPDLQIGRN